MKNNIWPLSWIFRIPLKFVKKINSSLNNKCVLLNVTFGTLSSCTINNLFCPYKSNFLNDYFWFICWSFYTEIPTHTFHFSLMLCDVMLTRTFCAINLGKQRALQAQPTRTTDLKMWSVEGECRAAGRTGRAAGSHFTNKIQGGRMSCMTQKRPPKKQNKKTTTFFS